MFVKHLPIRIPNIKLSIYPGQFWLGIICTSFHNQFEHLNNATEYGPHPHSLIHCLSNHQLPFYSYYVCLWLIGRLFFLFDLISTPRKVLISKLRFNCYPNIRAHKFHNFHCYVHNRKKRRKLCWGNIFSHPAPILHVLHLGDKRFYVKCVFTVSPNIQHNCIRFTYLLIRILWKFFFCVIRIARRGKKHFQFEMWNGWSDILVEKL